MTVYLDHAATTPLRPEARDAWLAAADVLGNPSSIHASGQAARRILEESRERLAAVIGCEPIEVVFTSGGTESINLALKGAWYERGAVGRAIVLPGAEHHATMDAVVWLHDHAGADVVDVPVDGVARIDAEAFASAVGRPEAVVATAMVANNEAGTLNDVASLAEAARAAGVPLHLDAVAAFGHVPLRFSELPSDARGGAALLSVSAHKIGGPASVGALVVSRSTTLTALHHGGGGQRSLRAGTADVPGAAAFSVAAEAAEAERVSEHARLSALRDALVGGVIAAVPEAELLGDPAHRLPGNAHLLFPGAAGESLLFLLDTAGVSASTGSACQAGVAEPSHVVRAMGRDDEAARSVLRFTLGRTSTQADVDRVVAVIGDAYRRASR